MYRIDAGCGGSWCLSCCLGNLCTQMSLCKTVVPSELLVHLPELLPHYTINTQQDAHVSWYCKCCIACDGDVVLLVIVRVLGRTDV